MTSDPVRTAFPNLCSILAGSALDADMTAAVSFAQGGEESLRDALEAGLFTLNELMWLLAGSLVPNLSDPAGQALESGLAAVVAAVGPDVARRTYRDKLLVNNKNTLEDTRYEVAVTARACAVLDQGTIQLEKPIPDARKRERDWKNTDVYGTYQGQPVRIEVTVLHESLPPAIHEELDRLVASADVSSGFQVTLRHTLTDKGYAERMRALLELLHESHVESKGKDVEIDGIRFEWRKGSYQCSQATSPFQSIVFHSADDFEGAAAIRDIVHPCSVRNVTPKFILEDDPNPPGVITSADLPDAPTNVPVSTKIHQMLAGKLQQCEQGVVNIIAFGNPLPMHDREVASAVLGAEVVTVPFTTDAKGVRQMGQACLQRNPKAPFAPAQCLASEDDRIEFVDPFRRMSAVWHIRVGWYARSNCIPNPNASRSAPQELLAALSDPPTPARPEGGQSVPEEPSAVSAAEEDVEEIVWPEMAKELIGVCGSVEEAKRVLEGLEASGLSLEEMRSRMADDAEKQGEAKFVSSSNEEVGMQFVIDCGGFVQAKACLEAALEDGGANAIDNQ